MTSIAVVGAGTMGAGIAQLAATHGCTVHLIDVNEDVLRRGVEGIRQQLEKAVEKGKLARKAADEALARVLVHSGWPTASAVGARSGAVTLTRDSEGLQQTTFASAFASALADVELAIEAVIEDLAVKQNVFRQLESATSPGAILATNTSSLSVSKIAEAVKDRSRVIGMHFFNPPVIMPLVEVIAGDVSDRGAVDSAVALARAWGKTPVRVKDTPGFIVNRVARGFYLEALRLLGEGVAGVDEIDLVMRKLGGFKMGPFELMDLIGLDVNYSVSVSVWEQMGGLARFAPHEIQKKLVDQRNLGRKAGRGFYVYEADRQPLPAWPVDRRSFQLSPLLSDALLAFTARAGVVQAGSTERFVFSRILGALLNEAGHALSDGIATREDIDTAMIKGTNYPKGPLVWSDEIGPRTVRGLLKALNQTVTDGRYEPAKLFAEAY